MMTITEITQRVDTLDPRLQAIQQYFAILHNHPDADEEDREGFAEMLTWAGMSRDILADIRGSAQEEYQDNPTMDLGPFGEVLGQMEQQADEIEQEMIEYHKMLAAQQSLETRP